MVNELILERLKEEFGHNGYNPAKQMFDDNVWVMTAEVIPFGEKPEVADSSRIRSYCRIKWTAWIAPRNNPERPCETPEQLVTCTDSYAIAKRFRVPARDFQPVYI